MIARICLVFLTLCTVMSSATAQKRGEWEPTLTGTTFGKHPVMPPVKLRYTLSWKGAVESGALTFELNKPDKRYPQYHISQIYGGSSGFARTLFPYQGNFVSFLNTKTLRPVSFVGEETDKREHMKTTNRYTTRRMTSEEVVIPKRRGAKKRTEKEEFTFPNTFDAMSAMYFIRSQPLGKGDVIRFVLHPFHSPYLATVTVKHRGAHNGRPAIQLDLQLRKIRSDFSLRDYKKMSEATLWLSDDDLRIPIELRSKVFIGDVRMTLAGVERL